MRIQHNITADNSHRQLGINTRNIGANTEKLSSGYRVNRAADDAAGLAISEKMRTQIRGLSRASLNIQDGVSLLQVGDGALQFIHNKMQRLRELSVQAANDTNQLLDREAIQLEFGQLTSEINEAVARTNFNERLLFDGNIGAAWEYNLGKMTSLPHTATIQAGADFASNPPGVVVPGWSAQNNFGRITVGVSEVDDLALNGFPQSGFFAMQIVTPADGTLNVIMDMSVTNSDGNMDWNRFTDFFTNGFNNLGLGHVVNNVYFDPLDSAIRFDFPSVPDPANPATRKILTGVMGRPVPLPIDNDFLPRVHVGLGSTSQIQVNSLNGQASVAPPIPGPFRSNRPVPPNAPIPVHTTLNPTFANAAILGSTTPPGIPPVAQRLQAPSEFPSATINVNGRPTTVYFEPGHYASIDDFVARNQSAFKNAAPHSFDLDIDESGRLVITGKIYSGSPTVTMAITPATLAAALGFNPIGIDIVQDDGGALWIQSGANEGDGVRIEIPLISTRALGLSIRRPTDQMDPHPDGFDHINGLGAGGYTTGANVTGDPMEYSLDVTSHERAAAALGVLSNAINIISTERARMGAQQNRLEAKMLNVDNTAENLQAAESRIRDTDMAKEMTVFVKNQILQQSSISMLAQANSLPQGVLQLLG